MKSCRHCKAPQGAPIKLKAGSCAVEDHFEALADVLQVGGITGVQLQRCCSLVPDVGERLVDCFPVDIALAQRYKLRAAVLEPKILDVQLGDALIECADPILRISIKHHVADVNIGLDPRALEF